MLKTIALLALLASTGVFAGTGEVVILNPDNFDSIVKDPTKNVFVKFFTPWCGFACAGLSAVWKELAESLLGRDDIVVASFDAAVNEAFSQMHHVEALPTMILYTKTNKEGFLYPGSHDLLGLSTFIAEYVDGIERVPTHGTNIEKTPPPENAMKPLPGQVFILLAGDFEAVVSDPNRLVFVRFFVPWSGNDASLVYHWKELASRLAEVPSVVIAENDIDAEGDRALAHGISVPALVVFDKHNKKHGVHYRGRVRTVDAWLSWLQKTFGVIGALRARHDPQIDFQPTPGHVFALDPENHHNVTNHRAYHVLVKFFTPGCGHCVAMSEDWKKLAQELVTVPDIIVAEMNAEMHREEVAAYGVQRYPTVKLFFERQ